MQRSFKDYLIITLKGMAMGAADVVPGVSGGTIAFITGIYKELIGTISGVDLTLIKVWKAKGFKAMWKQMNGPFILALISGILISIFTLMRLTNYLLNEYPVMTWAFFFGLIVASVWFVARQIPKWNFKIVLSLLLGAAIAMYITSLPPLGATITSSWFLFFAGAIAICAMILPGISGAFILVLLGAYKTVIEAAHDFDIKTLGIVALGAIFGLLSFSKILKWLFDNYSNITLAVLTGFIAGSLNKIWPWKKVLETAQFGDKMVVIKEVSVLPGKFEGNPYLFQAVILMLTGFLLILFLERIANQKPILKDAANPDL
jgi:putative membrane protein